MLHGGSTRVETVSPCAEPRDILRVAGRVAQRESASFTPTRSQVRSLSRPLSEVWYRARYQLEAPAAVYFE